MWMTMLLVVDLLHIVSSGSNVLNAVRVSTDSPWVLGAKKDFHKDDIDFIQQNGPTMIPL